MTESEKALADYIVKQIEAIFVAKMANAAPWVCAACGAVADPNCPHRANGVQGCGVLVQLIPDTAP